MYPSINLIQSKCDTTRFTPLSPKVVMSASKAALNRPRFEATLLFEHQFGEFRSGIMKLCFKLRQGPSSLMVPAGVPH